MKRNIHELRELILRWVAASRATTSFVKDAKPQVLDRGATELWWNTQLKNVVTTNEYALAMFVLELMFPQTLTLARWTPKPQFANGSSWDLILGTNGFALINHSGENIVMTVSNDLGSLIAEYELTHDGPTAYPFLTDLIGEAIVHHIMKSYVAIDAQRDRERAVK